MAITHQIIADGPRRMSKIIIDDHLRLGKTNMKRGKPVTGVRAVTDKSGRTRLQPTKPRVSVSKAIAMAKSKKEKVVSRERGDSVRSTTPKRKPIYDDYGVEVVAGCVVHFGYGIPGVSVDAKVIDRNGALIALTPGHKPAECRVDQLFRHVGSFWVKGDA